MTQEETYGTRDMTYSVWHRRNSTRRFVGIENAQILAMVDADVTFWIEYDDDDKEPLALVETAQDVGQSYKCATVMHRLAMRADLPCFVVLYTHADTPNPAAPQWPDISGFRVKRLHPKTQTTWVHYTPNEWAQVLLRMRRYVCEHIDGIEVPA